MRGPVALETELEVALSQLGQQVGLCQELCLEKPLQSLELELQLELALSQLGQQLGLCHELGLEKPLQVVHMELMQL